MIDGHLLSFYGFESLRITPVDGFHVSLLLVDSDVALWLASHETDSKTRHAKFEVLQSISFKLTRCFPM